MSNRSKHSTHIIKIHFLEESFALDYVLFAVFIKREVLSLLPNSNRGYAKTYSNVLPREAPPKRSNNVAEIPLVTNVTAAPPPMLSGTKPIASPATVNTKSPKVSFAFYFFGDTRYA